jgi:hypothetical protein
VLRNLAESLGLPVAGYFVGAKLGGQEAGIVTATAVAPFRPPHPLHPGLTPVPLNRSATLWYLGNVDKDLGSRVEKGVRAGQS